MINEEPMISVLMPVYNEELYLKEALDSILNQTYSNFELIIINDCSTDATEQIILGYSDPRIHYFKNERNLGIVGTLNYGLGLCKNKYIARFDGNDINHLDRFEKQINYMETHNNVVACGCYFTIIGKEDQGAIDIASNPDDIRCDMALYSQVPHTFVMLRNDVICSKGLRYKEEYRYAEDYKLWTELLQYGDIFNIPEILGKVRIVNEGISVAHIDRQRQLSDRVRKDYLLQLGIKTNFTLGDIVGGKLTKEQVKETLINYYPFIIRCKPYNWIRKNYVSCLKKYMKQLGRFERVKELRKFNTILSIKDCLSIVIK